MTTPAQFPFGADKNDVRRWLRERRTTTPPVGDQQAVRRRPTHESLLDDQHHLLMAAAGLHPDATAGPASEGAESSNRRRLDLALDGGQVEGHEAPIGLLGNFFTSLQSAVTSVAQALTGVPTAAAPVPGSIRAATLLRSAPAFPSSYGVHLFGPAQDLGLLAHEETSASRSTLLDEAISTIFDIAEAAQSSLTETGAAQADDRLVDRVVPLGQRAVKHLGELSGYLAEADVRLRLSWEPNTDQERSCVLDRHGAARLKRLSDGVDFGETTAESIEGLLVEASMRRGSVEIQKVSGEIVAARTDETVTPRLGDDLLGKHVVAEARVTTVRYTGGRERRVYTVTALHPAEH